ncbi:MAG: tRNA pseudouridine(55) synthase TruB [Hyphomicrobiaceae bacterium]|nr:tRNA pseudouridine(55) synthase TruB [Hyphomicrobiaceae bacterium]
MARRKRGQPVHGWLILDKPLDITSTTAVNILKRIFDAQKAGHAGTLDPLATGVLPVAFGEATKTMPFVAQGEKTYRFTVRWGQQTNTDDAQGEVVESSDQRPSAEQIYDILDDFIGEVEQIPPAFSAIHIKGERAYTLARRGESVQMPSRLVNIYDLRVTNTPDADHCEFEVDCGSGTYVRAIARDMGVKLGCFGHVAKLRRTRVGRFHEDMSISLDKLRELSHSAPDRTALLATLLGVETALDDIPELAINANDAFRLQQGQSVLIRGANAPILSGPVYATLHGTLIAIGEIKRGALMPTRVFNL